MIQNMTKQPVNDREFHYKGVQYAIPCSETSTVADMVEILHTTGGAHRLEPFVTITVARKDQDPEHTVVYESESVMITPNQARELAATLMECADKATCGRKA